MKDLKEKYYSLLNEVRLRGFKKLDNHRIYIKFVESARYGAMTCYFIFFSIIIINKERMRKSSVEEMKALLAHELGHILRFREAGFFEGLLKGAKYLLSKKSRTLEEWECDKLAIRAGYARGLHSYRIKNKKRKSLKYYMSAQQVKDYTMRIGKW